MINKILNLWEKKNKQWLNLLNLLNYRLYNPCKKHFQFLVGEYVKIRRGVNKFELNLLCPIKASIFFELYLKGYMINKIFERTTTLNYQDSKFSKYCGSIYAKQKDVERYFIFEYQKSKYYRVYYWNYYFKSRKLEQKMVFKFKKTNFYRTLMSIIATILEHTYIMFHHILAINLTVIKFFLDIFFIALAVQFLKTLLNYFIKYIIKPFLFFLNDSGILLIIIILQFYESRYYRFLKTVLKTVFKFSKKIFFKFFDFQKKNFSLIYKAIPVKLLLSYTSILIFYLFLILCLYFKLMTLPLFDSFDYEILKAELEVRNSSSNRTIRLLTYFFSQDKNIEDINIEDIDVKGIREAKITAENELNENIIKKMKEEIVFIGEQLKIKTAPFQVTPESLIFLDEIFYRFGYLLELQEEYKDLYLVDISPKFNPRFQFISPRYIDRRPLYLISEGWKLINEHDLKEKMSFIYRFLIETRDYFFLARTFEDNNPFNDNYLKAFFTEGPHYFGNSKVFIRLHPDVFLNNIQLFDNANICDYVHSISIADNRVNLFIDSELLLKETWRMGKRYYEAVLIEKSMDAIIFFLEDLVSKIRSDIKLKDGKLELEEIEIRDLKEQRKHCERIIAECEAAIKSYDNFLESYADESEYKVLDSQNFIFVYKYKILIYILFFLHSILGGLNFLYDYFFKRMKEDTTKSLWIIYINLVIVIFYILIYVVFNLFFFFP